MSGPDSGDHDEDGAPDGPSSSDDSSPVARSDDSAPAKDRTPPDVQPTRQASVDDGPSPDRGPDVTIEDDGVVRWFLRSDDGSVVFVRDVLSSVAIVAVIGLLLFGVSGIWPPLVAVESGSMEPNMERGDLIFVVDNQRFVGEDPVGDTGVVTLEAGLENGHETFGQPGDVVVFMPDGNDHRTPVIHRAHFWVEEGENWIDTKADEEIVGDATCEDVSTCPAAHDGFVTKGDANAGYDQYRGGARTNVVKPEWVTGKAQYRIPYLGHVRLLFDGFFGGLLVPVAPATGPMSVPVGFEQAIAPAASPITG